MAEILTECMLSFFYLETMGCDNDPCQNGGSCTNDPVDPKLFSCACADGFSGDKCEITSYDTSEGNWISNDVR